VGQRRDAGVVLFTRLFFFQKAFELSGGFFDISSLLVLRWELNFLPGLDEQEVFIVFKILCLVFFAGNIFFNSFHKFKLAEKLHAHRLKGAFRINALSNFPRQEFLVLLFELVRFDFSIDNVELLLGEFLNHLIEDGPRLGIFVFFDFFIIGEVYAISVLLKNTSQFRFLILFACYPATGLLLSSNKKRFSNVFI